MSYNPRWPHTFTVLPECLDSDGVPITDENGIPITDLSQMLPPPQVKGMFHPGDSGEVGRDDEPGSGSGSGSGSGLGGVPYDYPDSHKEVDPPSGDEEPSDDEPEEKIPSAVQMVRIIYDDNYNPRRNADGSFVTETVTEMPWGYRTATGGLKTAGEVIVADYKISAPMMLTELPTGTILMLTDYTHTFRVKVLKMTTYNWGTNIWVDNIKN